MFLINTFKVMSLTCDNFLNVAKFRKGYASRVNNEGYKVSAARQEVFLYKFISMYIIKFLLSNFVRSK